MDLETFDVEVATRMVCRASDCITGASDYLRGASDFPRPTAQKK